MFSQKKAQEFRQRTKQAVQYLPYISYSQTDSGLITQEYRLPQSHCATSYLPVGCLNDEQELALTTMRELGKFGHPLFRAALRAVYR